MIICVCGMIGSGKSSWSEKQNGVVSDFDQIHDKKKQIDYSLKMHSLGETVYHITCFPNADELNFFMKENAKFVWINTSFGQCKKNILNRKRERDVRNLPDTLNKNREILAKYMRSNIKFIIKNIFENNEKW